VKAFSHAVKASVKTFLLKKEYEKKGTLLFRKAPLRESFLIPRQLWFQINTAGALPPIVPEGPGIFFISSDIAIRE
jgi:hypothetical protein